MNAMHRFFLRAGMPMALLCLALPVLSAGASDWTPSSAVELDRRLAALVDEDEVVGMALGVVVGDERVFGGGYGVAMKDGDRAVDERSVFHWASVSKPFVAVGIMQLVEGGRLSLDDKLVDVVPYFEMADPRYRDITIFQLLTHTAGMPDVDDYEWDKPQTDDEALKRWVIEQSTERLLFEPGTAREYSNIGFEILGLVIQEVSGESFEVYMSAKILQPAGMRDSSFIAYEIAPELRTSGHTGTLLKRTTKHYPYNRRHAPSSTLNSNIVDMSGFALALMDDYDDGSGGLLQRDTVLEMWGDAYLSTEEPGRTYGLGWNVGTPWGEVRSAVHGGGDDGYRSFLYIAPEERVAVFVAVNDETANVGRFVRAALEVLLPEHRPPEN